jgi:hypothetical protein
MSRLFIFRDGAFRASPLADARGYGFASSSSLMGQADTEL